MLKRLLVRVRHPALWIWVVCLLAVGTAVACSDLNAPRVTEENDDTLQDSLSIVD